MKKTVRDVDVRGKRVLMRVDFNVPLDKVDRHVVDDTRIRAALPTIGYLRQQGARLILCSHLGRPDGKVVDALRLTPVAHRLAELLGSPVKVTGCCIGAAAEAAAQALAPGEVLLLENLRFHPEEEANDPAFAGSLASLAEVYVNDAFGTAHRAHASTEGVARRIAARAPGLLMEKELQFLSRLLGSPERPFVALLGGAKVSGKIDVLRNLLPRVDALLIGGAMMFTFWKAENHPVGRSLVEEDLVPTAREVLSRATELGRDVVLPADCIATEDPEKASGGRVAAEDGLGTNETGVDIGPASRRLFAERLTAARTIFWNGPMGIFEREPFAAGTLAMAEALARATERGATTVVGGGDSVAALQAMGLADRVTHISTGGGASLEFLEGKTLPGVAALEG